MVAAPRQYRQRTSVYRLHACVPADVGLRAAPWDEIAARSDRSSNVSHEHELLVRTRPPHRVVKCKDHLWLPVDFFLQYSMGQIDFARK
jgi:hypothetical protein